jgi:hypothetical protein
MLDADSSTFYRGRPSPPKEDLRLPKRANLALAGQKAKFSRMERDA